MENCSVCGESHRDGGLIFLIFGVIFTIFPLLNPEWEGFPIIAVYIIVLLGLILNFLAILTFMGKIHMGEE